MSLEALGRISAIRSRFGADAAPNAARVATSTTVVDFAQTLARVGAAASTASRPASLSASASTFAGRTALGGSGPTGVTTPVLSDATPYAELFRAAGATYGIDPSLLAAVAKVESGFNPEARSSAGAEGLMQFMPGTSSGMGVDPWDPASAIDGAARLLRAHRDRFGSMDLALAAYNAGAGNVTKYGGVPPFPETEAYVAKVLALAPGAA